MPKKLLQDMVKVKRTRREIKRPLKEESSFNSLKNINVNSPKLETSSPSEVKTKTRIKNEAYVATGEPNKNRLRYALWSIAIISIIFFLFSISYLFFKVVVTVNPKIQDLSLDTNFSASLNGGGEVLPFDFVVISGEESKIVQATEAKDVLEKAQGVVVIYNAFSSTSQLLSIDTRLEGTNGKIYKTKKQIVVPGMKGSTPGSVEVGIYGTASGEEYNSAPLDFTIFGFKGTPKYSKIYARSKGEITGGFKGKASVISDAEKVSTINELKTNLQAKLFKKATDQIPNGFILFKDASFFNVDDENTNSLVSSKDDTLPIKIKGTLYGLLFDVDKLTRKIAKDNVKDYDGSPVYLSNIKDLSFSLSDKDNVSFGNVKNINFNLKGNTKIVWKLDEGKFRAELLGKSKKDFNQILLKYPNVNSANLSLNPFWKTSLPDKIKDIKVIVNYPE